MKKTLILLVCLFIGTCFVSCTGTVIEDTNSVTVSSESTGVDGTDCRVAEESETNTQETTDVEKSTDTKDTDAHTSSSSSIDLPKINF